MKNYLQNTLKEAMFVWLSLALGIFATSVLYAVLVTIGVSERTSISIAFVTLVVLIIIWLVSSKLAFGVKKRKSPSAFSMPIYLSQAKRKIHQQDILSTISKSTKPIEVFISYASQDQALLTELEKHLRLLEHQGLIHTWHDQKLLAGSDWASEINMHLNKAQVILLLISPDFMSSVYSSYIEKKALEKYEKGEANVIPIILRSSHWKETGLEQLKPLPTNAKPILSWDSTDAAFYDVTRDIQRIIEQFSNSIGVPKAVDN